jgi:GNAT superfamily N-acetyltransferase
MEHEQYRVITYRPEYRGQILEVLKHLWGPSADLNAAYLDWKHLRNPYLNGPLIYLAMHGKRVVGVRSFVGSKWQYGSPRQTLMLPLASDAVTAPDHRNRGLASLLMQAALKDLAEKGYTYVLSMGTQMLTIYLRLGWRSIGSLEPSGRVATPRQSLPQLRALLKKSRFVVSVYRKLRRPVTKRLPYPFDLLDGVSNERQGKLGAHISIRKGPRDLLELVQLRDRLDRDPRIRHVQDEGYYAWRLQNPRSNYRFLFWDDSALQGYAILQASAHPFADSIHLIDWGATSDDVLSELLRAAIQLTGDGTLATWSGTLSERERRIFAAIGFKPLPEEITLYPWVAAVRPVRDELMNAEWRFGDQQLLDIGNWDFRILHSRAF